MNRIIGKLIAAVMALVLSVVMIVTISYAWMTLSSNPAAEGIQISVGGGNTILIAANKTETVEDAVYSYPDVFSDTLNFSRYEEYDYLNNLSSLTPVSTSDGIHWFLPEYYDLFDEEVTNGQATAGQIKPISEFWVDTELEYANLSVADRYKSAGGSYVYIDFWVVSPGEDCKLRISQGDENGGSYLLELMSPEEADKDGDGIKESFTLTSSGGSAAASARIGFLVNEDYVSEETLACYQESTGYSNKYTKLRGSYQQKGKGMWYSSSYRFTVYEPNGDLHPLGENGTYTTTSPIAWNGESGELADISDSLTVQLSNTWKPSVEAGFAAVVAANEFESVAAAKSGFYNDALRGQLMSYVNKGCFIKNTASLYGYSNDGIVSQEELNTLNQAGATDDVYVVSLEKNVPQQIRMFIWLEGQDEDCVDAVNPLDIALSIELAGSNKED